MEKNYRLTKEQYSKLKTSWKVLVDKKEVTADDMLIYNLLRDQPLKRGFVLVTNLRRQKANDAWYAFNEARMSVYRYYFMPRIQTEGLIARYNKRKEEFQNRYGVGIPDDFETCIDNEYLKQ